MTLHLKNGSHFWSSLVDTSSSNRRVKSWFTYKKENIVLPHSAQNFKSLTYHCILTNPFVSRNLGKMDRISRLLSGSLISFRRCWKVSLIFWRIKEVSVVWFSKEMASWQASPSSCFSTIMDLWASGPPEEKHTKHTLKKINPRCWSNRYMKTELGTSKC